MHQDAWVVERARRWVEAFIALGGRIVDGEAAPLMWKHYLSAVTAFLCAGMGVVLGIVRLDVVPVAAGIGFLVLGVAIGAFALWMDGRSCEGLTSDDEQTPRP